MPADLVRDFRVAVRQSLRHPGFSAAVVFTLALGIGASTAVFSLVYGILLRPYPYRDAGRLVVMETATKGAAATRGGSLEDVEDWRRSSETLETIGAHATFQNTLDLDGNAYAVTLTFASWHVFPMLGVAPSLGRTFAESEDRAGGDAKKAILSDGLWRRLYGGDPAIFGRIIQARGDRYTVIGVMPPGFRFPERTDLWVPLMARYAGYRENFWQPRDARMHAVIARLRQHVSLEQAADDAKRVSHWLSAAFPDTNRDVEVRLTPLREAETGRIRPYLVALLGAVLMVLLIGCVNAANLLLARGASREKEIAIRTALGSGRWPIVRQLLAGSVLLSAAGGVLGIGLAAGAVRLFPVLAPVELPFWMHVDMNATVALFCVAVSLMTGVVFGLFPALQMARSDLNTALKHGARGSSGSTASARTLRDALVVGEVALSVVLLIGAGLMIESFLNLKRENLGVQTQGLVTAFVAKFAPNTTQDEQLRIYSGAFRRILEKLEQMPGVVSAGAATDVPYSLWQRRQADREKIEVTILGQQERESRFNAPAQVNYVTPGFFPTLGVRFVEGRNYTEADDRSKPSVVIINRRMAEALWPWQEAAGRQIRFGSGPDWTTVIGVTGDINYLPTEEKTGWEVYWHYLRIPVPQIQVVAAVNGEPSVYVDRIRAAIRESDPQTAIVHVKTLERLASESLWQSRLWGLLFTSFAVLALVLAVVGLYGVMSYLVGQRTREIGIRVALGAKPATVAGMVTGQGLRLVLAGAAGGLVLAFLLTRTMQSLLFGVEGLDLPIYAAVLGILILASLAACAVPALRACRVDPATALRQE